ncbi:unnamed protein product [Sphenostylis stenocarpa]|uniref:Epidermal patterning factor-like protein n=1 Tax=Sphenostylis stenocarpa TaxID=92480 RepID=A0AA86VGX7_9FABA|nr:unnamed protein product [Sphenostylis stenocarpa]
MCREKSTKFHILLLKSSLTQLPSHAHKSFILPLFPEMGFDHHVICGQRLGFLCICFSFLIISSWIQKGLVIEGRKTKRLSDFHQTVSDDKIIVRPRIGSRPPKCERRCRSCEHCEAIQVPTNPQAQNGKKNSPKFSSIAYARVGGSSNYKPMSWKCKCGNLIFNP